MRASGQEARALFVQEPQPYPRETQALRQCMTKDISGAQGLPKGGSWAGPGDQP